MSKKRFRRITVRIRRAVRVQLEIGGRWQEAESVDLSLGGICLRAPPPFRPRLGEAHRIRVHLPERSFEALGRVCWSRDEPREAGLQFERLLPEDVLALARWLKLSSSGEPRGSLDASAGEGDS